MNQQPEEGKASVKNIKDYLHLYLGCECNAMGVTEDDYDDPVIPKTMKLTGISYDDTQKQWWGYFENEEVGYMGIEEIFPILRPLSDMTEEEEIEMGKRFEEGKGMYGLIKAEAIQTMYLLSEHFDLFDLIESGLAIDATKLV